MSPPSPSPNVPATPTRLPQPYLQRECNLTWTASELQGATYELELVQKRGKNVLSTKTLTTDKTSFFLEGLEPGYTYTVRLRALPMGCTPSIRSRSPLRRRGLGNSQAGRFPSSTGSLKMALVRSVCRFTIWSYKIPRPSVSIILMMC